MDGHTFMRERNRLLSELDRQLLKAESLPRDKKKAAREKAQAAFDDALSKMYAELDGCGWNVTAIDRHRDTEEP